ncbi:hypothetical protein PF005_g33212 [Phytophthora fragariae]|uniref:Uncharacterized protein n=1 Tax=Phytophthora fragariae TaxID=53985 RepID=A0A6A3D5A4_9STRA|nr:hypothetical protein PF003_g33834 [Phytophthora fragariae]KAE8916652.1 hypothetical protein PF009_g33025 [Phytophthora fragariae]KAE8953171.1 hypothetical protein PF011_g32493 [Phytophthora fragariae]KAE9055723.1 hypothetical protein PF010_g32042 [Phytophthora fragariae]KAE9057216.1 hypothetical protein PF007_g31723 [Phytophthora fragariae]
MCYLLLPAATSGYLAYCCCNMSQHGSGYYMLVRTAT